MKETKEIITALKTGSNELTESPYWLILDPAQNMNRDLDALANQITGPFFCRKDAAKHLKNRRYAFSDRAKVYCHSGYWSQKYKNLCRKLEL